MLEEIVYQEKNGLKQVAGLCGGELREFVVQDDAKANEGNIYLGRITKKIQTVNGKEGYFVNIGMVREAFINAEESGLEDLKAHEGQDIVVQVVQEQRAEKGARLGRFLNFAGVYLVYRPYGDEIEISSKIEDEDKRESLYQLIAVHTEEGGFVVRTQAAEASKEDILNEKKALEDKFEAVLARAKQETAPCLLAAKENILKETVCRNLNTLQRLVVNSHLIEQEYAGIFPSEYMVNPFEEFGIDEMLGEALDKVVKLPCGGRIIIEETKACVVIDVDSGEGSAHGNFGRLNQEAAQEIAKQIVLRNLSGKIIIDFAGFSEFKFLKPCLQILEDELKDDFARARVLGLSRAGNVEIIRPRRRPTLSDLMTEECPTCRGTGRVEK